MKILVLASNFKSVTPDSISAPERIASIIADGMVERGHEVALAASGDSKTKARLFSVHPSAGILDPKIGQKRHIDYEIMLIKEAINLANRENFDLICSQFDTRSAILASWAKCPVISVLHSPLNPSINPILTLYNNDQKYISISDSQRMGNPKLNYVKTIHHGVDTDLFEFEPQSQNYLITVGRAVPEKAFDLSIEIAKKSKQKLKIITSVKAEINKEYLKKHVYPEVDNKNIFCKENVPYLDIHNEINKAKAFIFPIKWEEAFGLVLIESMASGTPVIAYAHGSVPEIVLDGETGFIVNTSLDEKRGDWIVKKNGIEGMVEAINKIYSMPENEYKKMRERCRKHTEKNFTIKKMLDEHEETYKKVISEYKR
ncbi:MAG: glycosyltransferase [bacterium]